MAKGVAISGAEIPLIEGTARERLVAAASRLFCRFGINSVGVDTVVAEAGIAKATLYKAFGSKEKLVEAVLEREGRLWRDWFLAGLDAGSAAPIDRLRRIFPLMGEWFAQDRFYGCPFINAIGESDKSDDRLRSIAIAHKTAVLKRIEELAGDAGVREPMKLAHQIGLLIDGAIVVAMITRDPASARMAADMTEQLLLGAKVFAHAD
jgi:AcrR family transcriptional regulator